MEKTFPNSTQEKWTAAFSRGHLCLQYGYFYFESLTVDYNDTMYKCSDKTKNTGQVVPHQ
jgi:hypothetical protein